MATIILGYWLISLLLRSWNHVQFDELPHFFIIVVTTARCLEIPPVQKKKKKKKVSFRTTGRPRISNNGVSTSCVVCTNQCHSSDQWRRERLLHVNALDGDVRWATPGGIHRLVNQTNGSGPCVLHRGGPRPDSSLYAKQWLLSACGTNSLCN